MSDFPLKHTVLLRTQPTFWETAADFATIIAMVATVVAVGVALYVHWDSSAPKVVAYLQSDMDKLTTSIVIENLGGAPAYDIVVSGFDLDFADPEFRPHLEKCFLFKGIPLLVQGQMRRTIIATNQYADKEFADKTSMIVLRYKRKSPLFGMREQSESFTLDYYSFAHTLSISSDLHDIARAAKKIAENFLERK